MSKWLIVAVLIAVLLAAAPVAALVAYRWCMQSYDQQLIEEIAKENIARPE